MDMRKRVAAVTGALATAALLAGPAGSLALDAGETVTSVTGTTQPAADVGTTTSTPRAVKRTRSTTTRQRAASEPVSATVQGPNPHGQGTVLAVALGGNEAVVVGRSRGEQRSDGYHGHTTTLGLFGNDVIGNDTGPGQTAKGPLAPVQEQLLDEICKGSSGNICVDVLRADSSTTATGSANHTRIAGLMLGGENGLKAMAADSHGNIQSNGDCQEAHGDVTLVQLMLGGNPLLDIGESASDSKSCPSGTTVKNSSNPLVAIGGQEVPLPGCGANAPGNLIDLAPLLTIACNAGAGTGAGGIVNDALAGTVLAGDGGPAGTISGAGTGAAAQAPPSQGVLGVRRTGGTNGGDEKTPAKDNGAGRNGNGPSGQDNGGPDVPASAGLNRPLTDDEADKLPYTGSDVVLALFIACCLLAAGLGLRKLEARPIGH